MGSFSACGRKQSCLLCRAYNFYLWPLVLLTDMLPLSAGMVSFALHLDKHLGALIAQHGSTTYAILFAIVFAETGLVSLNTLSCVIMLPVVDHLNTSILLR